MSYLDRLRDCSYTDPAGNIHTLMFDEVTREGPKKIGAFSLPQQDRSEIQDLGMDGIDHPMTLYIIGEDYDLAADAFWAGLSMRHTDAKPGLLAHPVWGDLTVKPISFSESRSFVEGMGRSVFTIQFKQIDATAKFPTTAVSSAVSIAAAGAATAQTATDSFVGPTTAADIAIVTNQATQALASLRNGLASVVSTVDDLASQFEAGITQATSTIGELIDTPELMAETIIDLVRMPATAGGSISEKIGAYSTLFDSLAVSAGFRSQAENDLLTMTLSASAIAAAEASTVGDLTDRSDAVAASDGIAALLEYFRSMMDLTGPDAETVAQICDLLALAQGYLLEASFSLKSARRKLLESQSDPLTVTFELYKDVTMLDKFCKDNALADDEFFVLPMGREVVWYE